MPSQERTTLIRFYEHNSGRGYTVYESNIKSVDEIYCIIGMLERCKLGLLEMATNSEPEKEIDDTNRPEDS